MNESGSKSKRRSGASSKSKPPEPIVIFLDRSLGKHIIAKALRETGVEVRVHDDYFSPDAQDQDWLPTVGEKGWIVLTKDRHIRYRVAELSAIQKACVKLFTLTGKDLQGPEMAQIFIRAFPAIRRLVQKTPGPFIAKITRSAVVSVWLRPTSMRGVER